MTVTADNKRRIPLRMAQPGDRFDVQVSEGGKVVLTKLVPETRANKVRLVRKHGYTVGVTERPIDLEALRKALDEFP
jgi:hypothetical protein